MRDLIEEVLLQYRDKRANIEVLRRYILMKYRINISLGALEKRRKDLAIH